MGAVRRAAARARSAGALHRHGEQSARAGGLSVSARPRMARAVSRAAHHRSAERASGVLTPDDFARIQADTLSLHAKALLPVLLEHARPTDPQDRDAVALLRQWNFDARATAAPPRSSRRGSSGSRRRSSATISVRSSRTLTRAGLRSSRGFSLNTLRTNDSAWCDNVTTERQETCDDAVTTALHDAVARSGATARRRRCRAGDGTRSTSRCFRIRASTRSRHCGRSSADRCRTAATGARWTSAPSRRIIRSNSARCRLPPDRRSVAGQRQPLSRRRRRVRTFALAALRLIFCRTGTPCAPPDADGPRGHRSRRDRAPAALASLRFNHEATKGHKGHEQPQY